MFLCFNFKDVVAYFLECTVCGDETEVHKYMGAVSCYVCSAFFAYTDPEKR